jgi:hypothetical protein
MLSGGRRDSGGKKGAINVLCHQGMSAVQNERRVVSNGCTGSEILERLSEDKIYDFTSCCDVHDSCYQICGMNKNSCDTKFKKCMTDLCQASVLYTYSGDGRTVVSEETIDNEKCNRQAVMYYSATAMMGNSFYEDAQSDHCKCVQKEEVSDHYYSYITDFYERYAPQNINNFKWEKYEEYSAKQFASLLNALYRNYNATSIDHIEGRIGKQVAKPKPEPTKGAQPDFDERAFQKDL